MPFPNPDTQFKPGQSGNTAGRPPGRSVTAGLLALLDKDDVVRNAVTVAILKGIKDGDLGFVKLFLERTEGKVGGGHDEATRPLAEILAEARAAADSYTPEQPPA